MIGPLACLEGICVVNAYLVPSKETEVIIIHDLFVRLLLRMVGRSPWFLLLFSNYYGYTTWSTGSNCSYWWNRRW
jgi:hypothetical protein